MRRKLEVTYDDMMQLREKGYSNKDIAYMLDVSTATVIRYIGKQGKHMESVCNKPELHWDHERKAVEQEPVQIQVIRQTIAVNGFGFELNMADKTAIITIPGNDGYMRIHADSIATFQQALEAVNNMF